MLAGLGRGWRAEARRTLADDGILEGGAGLEHEDGVAVAALGLARAGYAAAVRLHAAVKGARDALGTRVGDGALGGGDGEGGPFFERKEVVVWGGGGSGRDGGREDGGGSEECAA